MRAGLAFWAGVLGAAVIVLGMSIARALDLTGFNFGYFWGSLFTGTTTLGSWIFGFVITLILGGLIALIYAAVFEALRRSSWGWGVLGGVVHLIISGLVTGWIARAHPAIPNVISDPGYYTANFGWPSVFAFGILHLIFGAIVGGMYYPIHKRIAVPRGRLTEEQPVGVIHEEEEVSVPSAPEDRTTEDRSAVKPGSRGCR
jgi:hypothetical protein